eukprot:c17935_g1_i2.p1 GENE.c17935_g1_i2~~c17935_g1_i2.p1  ORF type:complete len:265 (+),score=48.56 c17935_g1_i2:453-1247(+)
MFRLNIHLPNSQMFYQIDIQVLTRGDVELEHGFTTRPVFATVRGRGVISGLKYLRVSSKYGGSFTLVLRVVPPKTEKLIRVIPFVSGPIQVLSYRLYQAPKLPIEKLTTTDCVSRMMGIGPLYAKRFAAVNISTVADLAMLNLDALSKSEQWKLLCTLRKSRGDMTVARLQAHISQAREIVRRAEVSPVPGIDDSSPPQNTPEDSRLPGLVPDPITSTVLSEPLSEPASSPTARNCTRKRKDVSTDHDDYLPTEKRMCIQNLLC